MFFWKIEDTKKSFWDWLTFRLCRLITNGPLHCQLAGFLVHLLCKELDWILGTHAILIQFQFNSYLIKIKVAREELWFMTTPYFCKRYLSKPGTTSYAMQKGHSQRYLYSVHPDKNGAGKWDTCSICEKSHFSSLEH